MSSIYEGLHGRQINGRFTTIEATLPLAVIEQYRPEHPVIDKVLAFFEDLAQGSGGAIMDGDMVSAEGSYTVAYPLAVMARVLGREEMAHQAIQQLLLLSIGCCLQLIKKLQSRA